MAPSEVLGAPNGAPKTNGVKASTANGHGSSYAAKHNLAAHFIGGNHLGVAEAGSVKNFVADNDGHTVITSVSFYLSEAPTAVMVSSLVLIRCSLPTTELPP